MKTFHVHIGLPRCASTLIETMFLFPQHEGYRVLRESGILPLPRLFNELRRAYRSREWDDEFLGHLRDYHVAPLLSHDTDTFFVSDEGLTGIDDEVDQPTHFRHRATFLANLLDGFQTRALLLVRKQPGFIVSMYALHLQNGGTLDFDAYLESFPVERLDWLAVAEVFADTIGEENLTVIPFEKALHPGNGSAATNFLDAVQESLGVTGPVRLEDLPLVNPSLAPRYFPAKLAENRATANGRQPKQSEIPETVAAFEKSTGDKVIADDKAEEILTRFSNSNRQLFSRFMPGYDASFYQPGATP